MSGAGRRPRVATVWLAGCSGCHMSLLDTDEWLFELAAMADVVYGPLVDVKTFPTDVDVTLVEGAVANTDNLEMARIVRRNSSRVIAFGDCAVTGNVTAARNTLGPPLPILQQVYVDRPDRGGQIPDAVVPRLLERVEPLGQVIAVDGYLPGCPPTAAAIRDAIEAAVAGDMPHGGRFG